MIHSPKPSEVPKKLFAKGRLEPGKVLMLGGPTSAPVVLLLALMAKDTPGVLALAGFHTTANKVSSFGSQRQVLTTFGSGGFAKRTNSLVYHSSKRLAAIRISPMRKIVKQNRHAIVTFRVQHLIDGAMRMPVQKDVRFFQSMSQHEGLVGKQGYSRPVSH